LTEIPNCPKKRPGSRPNKNLAASGGGSSRTGTSKVEQKQDQEEIDTADEDKAWKPAFHITLQFTMVEQTGEHLSSIRIQQALKGISRYHYQIKWRLVSYHES
jgi:hypothetical protein